VTSINAKPPEKAAPDAAMQAPAGALIGTEVRPVNDRKSCIELKAEDFGDWDADTVLVAGGELLGTVADIAYHHTNHGEGWYPFADEADVPAVIAEVRGHIERLETAIKKAKADIASVERPARLAAIRRRKAEEAAAR
jgi:hypothetical protein